MAISAVLLFTSDGDVRKMYDAVIDEMGVRDHAPHGEIHHWCAPVSGGLRVCDLWETRDVFEDFAKTKIGPITAKHGFERPAIEVTPVHEMIAGRIMAQKGTGVFVEFDGETVELLRKIDEANKKMNVTAEPPDGLVFHWASPSSGGVRVIDHWRSREEFDRFAETRLSQTMRSLGMPQPRMTFFDIYNTIDKRVAAHA